MSKIDFKRPHKSTPAAFRGPPKTSPRRIDFSGTSPRGEAGNAIDVCAWARTGDNRNWRRVLKFVDRDGNSHTVLISGEEARSARLLSILEFHGYDLPTSERDQKILANV